MDLQYGEEKKEGFGEAAEEIGDKLLGDSDDESGEEDEDEEVVNLPSELAAKLDKTYATEEDLQSSLNNAGIGDLPVVLVNGQPRLMMPSDQHNTFTSKYVNHFANWSKLKWGYSSGTHKIHLSNGESRDPDLSYWGFPRCSRDSEGQLEPTDLGSVPDVIIQFSWKNTKAYEGKAINDMMTQSLEKDHGALSLTRPAVGYLIKVKFSRKRPLPGAIKGSLTQDIAGLDIYRLPHGTTIADAESATNGAEKWTYSPGGGQDRAIVITPAELGITGIWAFVCGDYKISVSEIYKKINKYQKDRQLEIHFL